MRRLAALGVLVAVAALPAASDARRAKPRAKHRVHHVIRKVVRPTWLSPRGALTLPAGATTPGLTVALPGLPVVTVPLPSPTAVLLPRRTGVLLDEWRLTPSRNPLAAGSVELDVTNSGEDDHDLTLARDGVVLAQTPVLHPGDLGVLTADLPVGDYRLYCSLFDGAHDRAGMHATLRVR